MSKTKDLVGQMGLIIGGAVLNFIRDLLTELPEDTEKTDRHLYDSDLIGEYNHRTGRLDAGNDPYGWYDED